MEENYDALLGEFQESDEVVAQSDGLYVNGALFAFLDKGALVAKLPLGRLADLEYRDIAVPYVSEKHPTRDWVSITDEQLWPEMVREAHRYVGEPQVGGES